MVFSPLSEVSNRMISEALVKLGSAITIAEIKLAKAIRTDIVRFAVARGFDKVYLFPNHYSKGGKTQDSDAIDDLANFYRFNICDSPSQEKWTPENGWEVMESDGL